GSVDLSVRVPAKMRLHLPLQAGDLLVEGGDDRGQGPHGSSVGGGQDGRPAQLRAAQRGQDRVGPAGDLAAAGPLEDRRYLGAGQPGGTGRSRATGSAARLVDRADLGTGDLPVAVGAVKLDGDGVAAGAVGDLGPVGTLGPR